MCRKLKSILLIDDDEDNNFIHRLVIEDTGWEVEIHETVSVKQAISYLHTGGNPDLIFLDINMPVLTGWDFIEEYQKLPISGKEEQIIVMLTSSVNHNDEEKARSFKEIAEYKNKPLTIQFLQEISEKYFRNES